MIELESCVDCCWTLSTMNWFLTWLIQTVMMLNGLDFHESLLVGGMEAVVGRATPPNFQFHSNPLHQSKPCVNSKQNHCLHPSGNDRMHRQNRYTLECLKKKMMKMTQKLFHPLNNWPPFSQHPNQVIVVRLLMLLISEMMKMGGMSQKHLKRLIELI